MRELVKDSKLELVNVDIIHAFPGSGKSGLVLSAFESNTETPYVIDTDDILFGFLVGQKRYDQQSKTGEAPWKQPSHNRTPSWSVIEEAAMMITLDIASHEDCVVVTNLVGTMPSWSKHLKTVTFAPTAEDSFSRISGRQKVTGQSVISKDTITGWHASYSKHLPVWANAVELGEGEYLCDYFGVKYAPDQSSIRKRYMDWLYTVLSKAYPNWVIDRNDINFNL